MWRAVRQSSVRAHCPARPTYHRRFLSRGTGHRLKRDNPLSYSWNVLGTQCPFEALSRAQLVYHGDVRVGSIAIRSGNPAATDPWGWSCGFYPGSHPREHQSGTAAPFDQAAGRLRGRVARVPGEAHRSRHAISRASRLAAATRGSPATIGRDSPSASLGRPAHAPGRTALSWAGRAAPAHRRVPRRWLVVSFQR